MNFAFTIGMLKLRRRLRSTRPVRRPAMQWRPGSRLIALLPGARLHIPVAPCLCGWREHIRR